MRLRLLHLTVVLCVFGIPLSAAERPNILLILADDVGYSDPGCFGDETATPWRLYKISQHGGGITSGGIAWWPGAKARAGRIESSRIHMVDVLPTFLEAAGMAPRAQQAGESFLPLVKGDPWKRNSPLFFQCMDNRAIRTHEWTLAEVDGAGWELFPADSDPLEATNVAPKNPDVVARLDAQWLAWWRSESGKRHYAPESTKGSPHYKPQGGHGSGAIYSPSAMPSALTRRHPIS